MKKIFLLSIGLLVFSTLNGQDLTEVQRSASNEHEHFGWTMAMDEQWLVVGSPHSETSVGVDAGKIIIYQKDGDTWSEFQVIEDEGGSVFDNFGFSIDLSSGVLVVGAIGTFQEGPFTGEAFVYEYDGTSWSLVNALESAEPLPGHFFGHAVATNGNKIVVSAIKDKGATDRTGAVYVYEKSNDVWGLTETLTADDGKLNDNFGYDVDININGRIVVGAPNQTDFIDKSGAVYVYDPSESGYVQTTKLKAFDRTEKDYFGTSVAINKNDIVVGAYLADGAADNSGAAYFFRLEDESWIEKQQLFDAGGKLNDYFGRSLDMSDFRLVIGAPKVNGVSGFDVGQGYFYEKQGQTWVLQQVLEDPNASDHNYFGTSLAVTDFDLAIGSKLHDGAHQDGGAVYASSLGEVLSSEEIELDELISLKNFPNPTQQEVTIRYRLLKASKVALEIIDQSGRPVNKLLEETVQPPGDQELKWYLNTQSGANVADGVYLYKLSIDGNVFTRRIIVAR